MRLCVSSGRIGDRNHQQVCPEAVRELGFCQRQTAVQILPERSGRTAAQTVAPLEERRGDRENGTAGAAHLTISPEASAPSWWFHTNKPTHTSPTYKHKTATHRSMHIGMHKHANTPSFMSSIFEQLLFGQKWTDIQPGVFIKRLLTPYLTRKSGRPLE